MKIAIKYGTLMFLGYFLLFAIMKFLNLYHIIELRALNFIIHSTGVFYALKEYQKASPENFGYVSGFVEGMRTTLIGAIPFALFMVVYLTFIEPEFLSYLQEYALHGAYITTGKLFLGLCMEAVGSGVLISYLVMRYTVMLASEKV
ncbi:DUF4199 domain-containing protein [Flammeovirga kamogawensis]|uniref:DUF4199 domain-containing protein n=1 Tax=Flammeovirga kamogawensis TaxID=373891 RepID=A0ABX8GT93_9BACT|nr:DUF4199 domain-containing protein [Flammeovirga kamogawensis]MBB6462972.1 hypothetical protein [Flammeovirga kamogawensis]QWG06497.1 DUF4199 domain-containing protein [Flammeovirga kamogawensis]TRX68325.1 DUF4199 domain-containing protein [Flammeovirga kamogawensis]